MAWIKLEESWCRLTKFWSLNHLFTDHKCCSKNGSDSWLWFVPDQIKFHWKSCSSPNCAKELKNVKYTLVNHYHCHYIYHHYMNLVHGPARHESFVAQWLEHPTGCSEGLRFNSCRGSDVFFVPCSGNVHHILSYSHYCCYRNCP